MALARERSPIPSSERVPGPRLSAAVQELVVTWRGRLTRVSLRALSLLPPPPRILSTIFWKSCLALRFTPSLVQSLRERPRTPEACAPLLPLGLPAGSRLRHDSAHPRTVGTPHCSARVPAPDTWGAQAACWGVWGSCACWTSLVPCSVTLTL